jgi:endogenous inhibitor of DNA gyrase (YacG/DUF329 family)
MEVKKIIKKCEFCGKEFFTTKSIEKTKFCSKKCYTEFQKTKFNAQRRRKKIICLYCGKEFEVLRYKSQKYCSIKCFAKHNNIINPKIDNRITKKCLYCGKDYKVYKYREKSSKFCSQKCHDLYRENIIECPSCGEIFKSPKYEKRKYCSYDCVIKGKSKRKSKFSNEIINFISQYYKIDDEYPINNKLFKYWADIKINNKIIECYGDYWHCNPLKYNEKYYHSKIRKTAKEIWEYDQIRKKNIESLDYKFMSIWEYDWNNNKELTMIKILKFIKNEV